MQGALITVSLILGIPVLCSKDPNETAALIVYAARQIRSTAGGGFQRRGYQPKNKGKKQTFILQGLPGVGHERAVSLLKRFGSVQGVINANIEELQSVDGIGRTIAEKIRWAVSEQATFDGLDDDLPI